MRKKLLLFLLLISCLPLVFISIISMYFFDKNVTNSYFKASYAKVEQLQSDMQSLMNKHLLRFLLIKDMWTHKQTGKVSKIGDTLTGNLTLSASGGERRLVFDFGSSNQMSLYGKTDNSIGLYGTIGGANKSVFEYTPSSGLFNVSAASFKYNGYTVWHSGNVSPVSKTGDTMSGALFFDAYNNIKTLVSASKPFIQMGGGEWALLCGQSGSALAGNAYQDGTDWYRYDATKPASVLYCYQDGTTNKLMLGTAPAGSGVINFTMSDVLTSANSSSHGQQLFLSSGTFTVPNVTTVWVSMCGGGGGNAYGASLSAEVAVGLPALIDKRFRSRRGNR